MKKIVLSLLLVFTLIPIVPSNTASATKGSSQFYVDFFTPIELSPADKEKWLGTCVSNADSFELSGPIIDPELVDDNRPPYQFGMKYESGEYSEPFSVSGGEEDIFHKHLKFSFPLGGKKGKVSFYIQKDYTYPLTLPYNSVDLLLNYNDFEKHCYNCTFLSGKSYSHGNCGPIYPPSTPDAPSTPDTPNGASRILAPLSALFGALLLLF